MEEKLERISQLIATKRATDEELTALLGGGEVKRKTVKCGHCNLEGHTARNCPTKEQTGAT